MRFRLILVSVLAVAALFIGAPTLAQESATPGDAESRTDVRYVVPFGPDGLNSSLSAAETVSGVCEFGSIQVTGRGDVWECLGDDGTIYDPCFENSFVAADELSELACMTSPFSTDVVLLQLEQPLVREKETSPQPLEWAFPWALELANGEQCLLSSEVEMVLASEAVHYTCAGGGLIVGHVGRDAAEWTVNYLEDGGLATTLTGIAVAWY